MVKITPISRGAIVQAVNGTVVRGTPDGDFTELGEPLEVGAAGVAFIISESFVRDVPESKAGTFVIQASLLEKVMPLLPKTADLCISAPDAYLGLAHLSEVIAKGDLFADWCIGPESALTARRSDGAYVHPTAKVDSSAKLGPGVVVCEQASIGPGSTLLANAVIGPAVKIGADCLIFPGSVIYPKTEIGNRVRLHANTVIGSDGFGYARGPRGSVKIWHLGRVIIGDDVEIGSGTTIDRGTLKDTRIDKGAKLDNLCQIGHNGHVKEHAILCAQVGLAGNVTVGRGAIMAGKAGVADKVEIGDGAIAGPMSGISKDIKPGETVMGSLPAKPKREWWRLMALVDRLPELFERIKKLESRQQ